ncbi:Protein of unknown function [Cnuella takakiae]|uniref:DUF3822 domain-containing protein n=1 Tax=Cnuella takakiae TaxID=1302690 RepID=A0A1M4XSB5_9BACT|nr:DUF3822 family protein [Cnuella takakiae]OLY92918.1 hypothetical protein BUE76_14250 [Cnuella takakiae]SHE96142.1 Protein of unknown function [Cnuella takakiae]
MRTLFESGSLSDAGNAPLLMELGTGYCLLSQLDGKGAEPRFARLWQFSPEDQDSSLQKIMDTVDAAGISRNKIRVALALPQTTLLPHRFDGKADLLLDALFPGQGSEARVYSNGHHYVFVVPRHLNALLHDKFNEVLFVPALACTAAAEESGPTIQAFFIDNEIRVSVHNDGLLLLQQQYAYKSSLDVVYYLLKICTEFGFSQQTTGLALSGFIAPDSALYQELHQYFLNIHFSHGDAVHSGGTDLPKHFFSSLFNLAQCAS